VLLPHNRASAKLLCDLARAPHGDPLAAEIVEESSGLPAHSA
jgi:hypothetical protein